VSEGNDKVCVDRYSNVCARQQTKT